MIADILAWGLDWGLAWGLDRGLDRAGYPSECVCDGTDTAGLPDDN